eukprot:scaffold9423_cov132-Isochrysis_galbana.AAC.4
MAPLRSDSPNPLSPPPPHSPAHVAATSLRGRGVLWTVCTTSVHTIGWHNTDIFNTIYTLHGTHRTHDIAHIHNHMQLVFIARASYLLVTCTCVALHTSSLHTPHALPTHANLWRQHSYGELLTVASSSAEQPSTNIIQRSGESGARESDSDSPATSARRGARARETPRQRETRDIDTPPTHTPRTDCT